MPQTEMPMVRQYPRRMETEVAAEYVRNEHGIPVEATTLANMRAQRRGPKPEYFGWKPLYDIQELDRWAEEDALQPESPLTRRARTRRNAVIPDRNEDLPERHHRGKAEHAATRRALSPARTPP